MGAVGKITLHSEAEGMKNSYWMVTVIVDEALRLDKMQVMKKLWGRGAMS